MPSKLYKELVEQLKNKGCQFKRQGKGAHEIWVNKETKNQTTISVTIESKILAERIKKQLGVS